MILIGCVRTKRATACEAAELFTSPLFAGRRRYAAGSGVPWYILSAKFGLLAPGDVIGPYDLYLGDMSQAYRKAWGEFAVAQLELHQPQLAGRAVEVHAGAAYTQPLRDPLAARGAALVTPLAHLRQGEQLAWYSSRRSPRRAPQPRPVASRRLAWPSCCHNRQARCLPRTCWPAGPVGWRYRACYLGGLMRWALRTCRAGLASTSLPG